MSAFATLAGLPLRIQEVALERRERDLGSSTRVTTTWHLRGAGEEGLGEDVVYASEDHDALQRSGPPDLRGDWSLEGLCDHVEALDLFPQPPQYRASVAYRQYAIESAALDLALRQAGTALHEALGREPRPVSFVASLGLGDPPTLEPIRRRLAIQPSLRFKVDATSAWTPELFAELAAMDVVDSVDLKGLYVGTPVDQGADPVLYQRVVDAFPDALIEDPALTDETRPVLEPHLHRVTWDAPVHGIADIEALEVLPRSINVKPSRTGPLRELFALYAWCDERDIAMYGGGQGELGVGRGQIQLLAALFHPEGPNDVAPGAYNLPDPPPGLPGSPLPPDPAPTGFRRAEDA